MEVVDTFNKLDEVAFSAVRLIECLENGIYLKKEDKEILIDALQIVLDSRANK